MVAALAAMLRPVPLRWVSLPGEALGWLLHALHFRKQATLHHITQALGEQAPLATREAICRASYLFFGGLIGEFLALPRIRPERMGDFITLENPELFDEALAEGKGVILVSGHLGNWELMGAALANRGLPLSMYVGAQKNLLVDERINALRRAHGTVTIGKGVAVRGLVKALRGGRIVAMLADQHYSAKRHYVRFFGHPVSQAPGPASLSLRSGAPVVFGACLREGRFRYRARFHRVTLPRLSGNPEYDLLVLSQAFTAALEDAIRTQPGQYFWHHRRVRPIPPKVHLTGVNKAFLAGDPPPPKTGE